MSEDTRQQATRDEWYCANVTLGWIIAAMEQGHQILKFLKEPPESRNLDRYIGPAMRSHIHEDFFVYAVFQVLDWGKIIQTPSIPLQKFQDEVGNDWNNKDIRNMRTHAADYFLGQGKAQERFIKSSEFISVDGSSTFSSNETGYLIGGRLNLQDIMARLEELRQDVARIQDQASGQMSGF